MLAAIIHSSRQGWIIVSDHKLDTILERLDLMDSLLDFATDARVILTNLIEWAVGTNKKVGKLT